MFLMFLESETFSHCCGLWGVICEIPADSLISGLSHMVLDLFGCNWVNLVPCPLDNIFGRIVLMSRAESLPSLI